MLDVLTDGRLEIGFGRGAIRHEQIAYGVDRDTTAELFEDGMQLLMRLLTERDVEFANPVVARVSSRRSSLRRSSGLTRRCGSWPSAPHRSTAPPGTAPMPRSRSPRWSWPVEHVARYEEAWHKHQGDAPRGRFSFGITIAVGETHADAERYAREPLRVKADRRS